MQLTKEKEDLLLESLLKSELEPIDYFYSDIVIKTEWFNFRIGDLHFNYNVSSDKLPIYLDEKMNHLLTTIYKKDHNDKFNMLQDKLYKYLENKIDEIINF